MLRPLILCLFTGFTLHSFSSHAEEAAGTADHAQLPSWPALQDQAKSDPKLAVAREKLIAKARDLAALPIIRRAKSLEEVGQNRTWLDGRSRALEEEIRGQFAMAMSDFGACNTLTDELPVLAAAYRLTGDAVFRDRVAAQLEEMSSWSPLQRPGWTLYTPGARLPADGKDGNWLATGCGARAIGNTLELLPEGTLDTALVTKLHALLESEVACVVDDWNTRRSWFIRSNNAITNQWVLPTEGLVRACLILGVKNHKEAYDLGVKNLMAALDAHGPKGEFEEGFGYASFTLTSLLHTAHAMAVEGDRHAIDHPFLAHFPTWLVHHFQPGNMVINCFDAGGAYDAASKTSPLLSLLAVCTGSPVARWALAEQAGGPSNDLAGLAASALSAVGPEAAPPLFAVYEHAARVNWRDSWDKAASGVWIRGGHALDQHDHQDRGHVNFISRGRPILIEAGTPSYDHKLMMTHYTSCIGHNVLQLGNLLPEETGGADAGKLVLQPGWQKEGKIAPITVTRLDSAGGEVRVDGTACYEGLSKWHRTVHWSAEEMQVTDEVAIAKVHESEFILFRWHLGTEGEVSISGDGGDYAITWPDAKIEVKGNVPLAVTQVRLPDNTLAGHDGSESPKNFHTAIVVQSREKVGGLTLTTRVIPR